MRAPGHRSSLVVALAVGASLFAACGGGSDDAASTPAPSSTPSSSRPAGTATPPTSRGDSSCPPARGAPDGPSAAAQVIQEGEGDTPRIEAAVYPAPEGGGEPWSQWGQGVVLPDGRFLSTAGDHRGADGNAYLFVYDPETRRITRVADVLSQVEHEEGAWGYGKIHAQLVASGCDVYLATYWGSRRGLEFSPSYDGDLLFRVDPSTLELEPLGTPVPRHGIPSLAGSPPPACSTARPSTRSSPNVATPDRSSPTTSRPAASRSNPTTPTTSASATSPSGPTAPRTSRARAGFSSRTSRAATSCGPCRTRCRVTGGSGRRPRPVPTGPSTA